MKASKVKTHLPQISLPSYARYFFVAGLFFFLSNKNSINSNDINPDSIKQQLHLSKGAEKIELLRALSNFYIADYQIDGENYSNQDFVKYATQLYKLDTKASLKEKMSLLYDINYCQLLLEDYAGILATRDQLHQLLAKVPEFDDYGQLFSFEMHAASAYIALDSISQYYTSLQKSVTYAEQTGNLDHLSMIYNLLGELYTDILQDYESGLSAYQKELNATSIIYEANKDDVQERNFLSIALVNVGTSYMHLNQLDSAAHYLTRAYQVIEHDKLPESKAYKVVALSKLASKQGAYERAFQLGKQALDLAKQGDGKQIVIESLINLAGIHLRRKDFEYAKAYLDQAASYIAKYDHKKLSNEKLALYEGYYQLYKEQDSDKALAYYEQFVALTDTVQNRQNMATILKSDIEFEARQEQLLYELKQNKKLAQQRLFTSILGILLLSATVIGSIAYRNSRRERKDALMMQELNAALSIKQEKLEFVNHKLSRFVHSISHDIKSKLDLIASYGSVIKNDATYLEPQQQKNFAVKTVTIAENLRTYCNELLSWSEQDTVRPDATDLNSLVNRVIELHRPVLDANDFSIKIESLPVVQMPEEPLLQIFNNLIDNAIKFTKHQAQPRLQVTAIESKDHWEIGVADNGKGMNAAQIERILSNNNGKINKGLYIIQDLLAEQGQNFRIASEVGQGTQFYFTVKK